MDGDRKTGRAAAPSADGLESSLELLQHAQDGDGAALERLCARYLPRLRRWASGRIPAWARDLNDTDDLVQNTLVAALGRLDHFHPVHEAALRAYLRQALLNRLRNVVRDTSRRPRRVPIGEGEADPGLSPLERTIGRRTLDRFEAAMAGLPEIDRMAVHLRLELGCGYPEIAEALGKPSPDAVRMTVSRALLRLAREMGDER